jgi:hypothetical protein
MTILVQFENMVWLWSNVELCLVVVAILVVQSIKKHKLKQHKPNQPTFLKSLDQMEIKTWQESSFFDLVYVF